MPRAKSKTPPADFGGAPVLQPQPEPAPPPIAAPASGDEPEILQRLDAPAKWSWALVAGGVVLAAGLSVFAVRCAMKKSRGEG
jgi:hypothetical protein